MSSSDSYPLGVSLRDGGANVAIYSETADSVDVAVFADGMETRTRLSDRTGHVFHGVVPGMKPGTRYGLRIDGPWDPEQGLRHNVNKVLLDPYASAISGDWHWGQAVFGHDMDEPTERDDSDSAGSVALSVVVDHTSFDWDDDAHPHRPLTETVVYETHVKGFTRLHPEIPEEVRGTYAGMAHPAAVSYLTDLGVTAVELLPVHQFVQDSHLEEKGLRNYWGYNSIGFFAPHGEYSSAGDAGAQVDEFKAMVKSLHAAGIEVILDVVYNHTAEGNDLGPMLSFKGIDNGSYYRLVEDDRGHYFDTTGTGNSLNVSNPAALGLIMDSLRHWVTEFHVDGFRFDLATTLTRQGGDASTHSAFTDMIQQDPTLARTKMIAEPWDTAGYQVGDFPAGWSEWNGKFRDDVRDFWCGESGTLGTTVQRILGSPDVYEDSRRSPLSSVDFITAHDGFTLHDLTAYDEKHNDANGEDNADGESDNRSSGYGAEGETDDEGINALRARQRRNLLATLLLSAGVPMILGGDELGRTQGGNNNAYCQDDEISWFHWDAVDDDLRGFTRQLLRLRAAEPALRPEWFRRSADDPDAASTVEILRSDTEPYSDEDWEQPDNAAVALVLREKGSDGFVLLINGSSGGVEFSKPASVDGWTVELTSDPDLSGDGGDTVTLVDRSVALLRVS